MTNGIDGHLGQRLRQRRWMLGLTQTQVGDMVGIKFQQIQKYETGQNRISAARLYDLATALGVTVGFFYEGYGAASKTAPDATAFEAAPAASEDPLADRETIELARAFVTLAPAARTKLVEFLRALASDATREDEAAAGAPSRPAPRPRSGRAPSEETPRGRSPEPARRQAG